MRRNETRLSKVACFVGLACLMIAQARGIGISIYIQILKHCVLWRYLPFFNCKLTPTQLVNTKYKTKIMKRVDVHLKVVLLLLLLLTLAEELLTLWLVMLSLSSSSSWLFDLEELRLEMNL